MIEREEVAWLLWWTERPAWRDLGGWSVRNGGRRRRHGGRKRKNTEWSGRGSHGLVFVPERKTRTDLTRQGQGL